MCSVTDDVATDIATDVAAWRPATTADLDAVERIGNAIHVKLQERPEVFANKLALFPQGCSCSRAMARSPATASRSPGVFGLRPAA